MVMLDTLLSSDAVRAEVESGGLSIAGARTIASWWHGGSDHNITALSHGCDWAGNGLREELSQHIRALTGDASREQDLAELLALDAWAGEQWITSHWSSYGHTFVDRDGDYVTCLECGGQWEEIHDDPEYPSHGAYRTWSGAEPTECSNDTDMQHGDAHESGHDGLDCPDGCEHCRHECNCLLCTG